MQAGTGGLSGSSLLLCNRRSVCCELVMREHVPGAAHRGSRLNAAEGLRKRRLSQTTAVGPAVLLRRAKWPLTGRARADRPPRHRPARPSPTHRETALAIDVQRTIRLSRGCALLTRARGR